MGLILVRYGEIALKGKNRSLFTRQLRRNIRSALRANGLEGAVHEAGRRMYVETTEQELALTHLQRVFGIVSLSPVQSVPREIEAMQREAIRMAEQFGLQEQHSFRTDSRRSDKGFPIISPDINRLVGGAVKEKTGARVELSGPVDLVIGIEVQRDRALMYGQVVPCAGGMPLPTAGRAVALLSGGIDSPVAAWMMMKRGCGIIPLHFSADPAETQKTLDNCRVLESYAYGWRMAPMIRSHAGLLESKVSRLHQIGAARWICIICKRSMLESATALAEEIGAQGVVMGDSLSQVASQTLTNLEAVSYDIRKPIYRPLIAMDKVEITALARKIGTFEISTRSSAPCQFLPANPLTRGSLEELKWVLEELKGAEKPNSGHS